MQGTARTDTGIEINIFYKCLPFIHHRSKFTLYFYQDSVNLWTRKHLLCKRKLKGPSRRRDARIFRPEPGSSLCCCHGPPSACKVGRPAECLCRAGLPIPAMTGVNVEIRAAGNHLAIYGRRFASKRGWETQGQKPLRGHLYLLLTDAPVGSRSGHIRAR